MKDNFAFLPDGGGCLQRAPWSQVSRSRRWRRSLQQECPSLPRTEIGAAEVRNDRGLPKIRIYTDTIVCTGQSPPDDHPHVALRVGQDGRVICPYCGTLFEFQPPDGRK